MQTLQHSIALNTAGQSLKDFPTLRLATHPEHKGLAGTPGIQASVRFGNGAGVTGAISGFMGFLEADRIRGLLLEDILGFGALRSGFDVYRGELYAGEPNWIAGRERFMREALSLVTDLFIPGLSAMAFAYLVDRWKKTDLQTNASFEMLDSFKDSLHQLPKEGVEKEQFLHQYLEKFVGADGKTAIADKLKNKITWEKLQTLYPDKNATKEVQKQINEAREAFLQSIAKDLGQDSYDIFYKHGHGEMAGQLGHFNLPELMQDLENFGKKVASHADETGAKFTTKALSFVEKNMHWKNVQLACLGTGLVATMAVPAVINWITRTWNGIDYYPAEIGLPKKGEKAKHNKKASLQGQDTPATAAQNPLLSSPLGMGQHPNNLLFNTSPLFNTFMQDRTNHIQAMTAQQALQGQAHNAGNPNGTHAENARENKGFWEKQFPYLHKTLAKGNLIPLALTLVPPILSLALNIESRRFVFPWSKVEGGYLKYLRNNFQFGKSFPFMTPKQIAGLYSMLILSRIACSRTENEFRERVIDGYSGWALWILGTPVLKNLVVNKLFPAKLAAQAAGAAQLNKVVRGATALRSSGEAALLEASKIGPTQDAQHLLGFGSLMTTVLLLGVIEPWLAIKWTQYMGASEDVDTSTYDVLSKGYAAHQTNTAQPIQPPYALGSGFNYANPAQQASAFQASA